MRIEVNSKPQTKYFNQSKLLNFYLRLIIYELILV